MPTSLRRHHPWLLPIIGVLALLGVVIGVITYDNAKDDSAQPSDQQTEQATIPGNLEPVDVAHRDPDDPTTDGDIDAPVAIVVYSDYQCPYCAEWARANQPTILGYVDNGDVRLEMRDVGVLGDPSLRGALAAQAAGNQGAYWPFHDTLMLDGVAATEQQLSEEGLTDLADKIGLDVDQFTADMTDPEAIESIVANQDEGTAVGVDSVPTVIIGGEIVVGAKPVDELRDIIDTAIAQADQD